MTELLFRVGVGNLCVSLVLALVAWAVQARGKRPAVAHLLWLVVLAKLVTPPLWTVPIVPVPGLSVNTAEVPAVPPAEQVRDSCRAKGSAGPRDHRQQRLGDRSR